MKTIFSLGVRSPCFQQCEYCEVGNVIIEFSTSLMPKKGFQITAFVMWKTQYSHILLTVFSQSTKSNSPSLSHSSFLYNVSYILETESTQLLTSLITHHYFCPPMLNLFILDLHQCSYSKIKITPGSNIFVNSIYYRLVLTRHRCR